MLMLTDGPGKGYPLAGNTQLTRTIESLAKSMGSDGDAALLALTRYLAGASLDATVSAAIVQSIAAAGSSDGALKALLDGPIGTFLLDQQGGTPPQTVLRTLANVSTPLTYDFEKSTASPTTADTGQVLLGFGASGKAQATISVVHAGTPEANTNTPAFPHGDALLAFELGADLDLQGAYHLPFRGGSLDSSAAAGTAIRLEALYQWPASGSVAGALMHSVDHLCDPWDLTAVAACLVRPNAQGEYRGLRQIVLATNGSVQLTGTVSVGRTWAYDSTGFAGASDLNASLTANLGLGVGWSRKGDFTLTVQRASSGGVIDVDVRRHDTSHAQFDPSLTAGLTVTGLGQAVQPIVDRAFPDPQQLLSRLRTWSAPGGLLVEKLQQTLTTGNPAFAVLERYLLGTASAATTGASLYSLVADDIKEQVDTRVPFWSQISQPASLAEQLCGNLFADLGLDPQVASPLVAELAPSVGQAISALHTQFEQDVTQLATGGKNLLASMLAPFAVVGENVQALAAAVDARADAIVAPTIKLLTAYEQVRNRVVAAAAQANRLKLGLALKASYQKQQGSQSELTVRINRITARTCMIYRALMLGRLDTVWGQLQEAVELNEIDPPTGAFTSTITRSKTVDLSVYFGDWTIDWQEASNTQATVGVDANGMITAGSQDRFSTQAVMTAFGGSDSASFGGTIDIASALQAPSRALPVTLGFALCYSNKRMTLAKLSAYLGSLISQSAPVQLLSPDAVTAALRQYGSTVATARLDTAVQLDTAALSRMLALTQSEDGRQTILQTARAALLSAHATTTPISADVLIAIAASPTAQSGASVLAELQSTGHDAEWISARYNERTGQVLPTSGGVDAIALRVYHDAQKINRTAAGLLDALSALQEAQGRLANALALASKPTPSEQATIYTRTLDATNRRVVDGLAPWFSLAGWYDTAPSGTVALLSALAQLGQVPAPLLVPVLQISGDTPRLLAF